MAGFMAGLVVGFMGCSTVVVRVLGRGSSSFTINCKTVNLGEWKERGGRERKGEERGNVPPNTWIEGLPPIPFITVPSPSEVFLGAARAVFMATESVTVVAEGLGVWVKQ